MYWTLDNRPPTLDERIIQAKARHAERVEQIAAEEPVPQLEVPKAVDEKLERAKRRLAEHDHFAHALSGRMLPGQYIEVPGSVSACDMQRQLREMAAQQNMYPYGLKQALGGFGQYAGTRASAAEAAAQRNVFADLASAARPAFGDRLATYPHPVMTEAQHTFQVTKDGTRWLSSRGPFYHPPISLGTLTEYR